MNTATTKRVLRAIEEGTIDECLRNLPGANPSAMHNRRYWAALEAVKELSEAKKRLDAATQEFHAELLQDWSEHEIKKAFPSK